MSGVNKIISTKLRRPILEENLLLRDFKMKTPLPDLPSRWERKNEYFRSDPKDWPRVDNPYKGFLGQYRKKDDPPNMNRKKGGILWAEQIINGVRDDDPHQIGESLTCKWSNVNQQVKGGRYGCPYAFSRASFFTQEQIDNLMTHKRNELKKIAYEKRMYLGREEWDDLQEPLDIVSNYCIPAFEKAVEGDNAFSLAVRVFSFGVCHFLLSNRGDPHVLNEDGVHSANLLLDNHDFIGKKLEEIEKVQYTRASKMTKAMTPYEAKVLKEEPLWNMRKFETIKLAERLYDYTVNYLEEVTHDAKNRHHRAIIDGYDVEDSILHEIEKEPLLHQYLEVLKKMVEIEEIIEMPEEYDPVAIELKRRNDIATSIQAWWRGYGLRLKQYRVKRKVCSYRLVVYFKFRVSLRKMREARDAKLKEARRRKAAKEESRIKRLEKSGALDAEGGLAALLRKNNEATETV